MRELLIEKCFATNNKCGICPNSLKDETQRLAIRSINKDDFNFFSEKPHWKLTENNRLAYSDIGPKCFNNRAMHLTTKTLNMSFTEYKKFSEKSPTNLIRYVILREFLLPITDNKFNTKFEKTSIALHEIISTGSLIENSETIRSLATNTKLYPRLNPNNLTRSYVTYHALLDLKSLYHSKKNWIPDFIESMTNHLCSNGYLTKNQVDTLNRHYDELSQQPCYKFKYFIT